MIRGLGKAIRGAARQTDARDLFLLRRSPGEASRRPTRRPLAEAIVVDPSDLRPSLLLAHEQRLRVRRLCGGLLVASSTSSGPLRLSFGFTLGL
ncbi:hypothetical protein HPB50_007971 [Hyalomma asiaticum]|uniref:Uncharacterized protein n=1 Tax=Hyalomma asiaticum TaxID=266040 RepID=A0ACB7T6L3_HYAAI|nr:hypothetical protein HPB50_007971 [Hyalomma asiaticum]